MKKGLRETANLSHFRVTHETRAVSHVSPSSFKCITCDSNFRLEQVMIVLLHFCNQHHRSHFFIFFTGYCESPTLLRSEQLCRTPWPKVSCRDLRIKRTYAITFIRSHLALITAAENKTKEDTAARPVYPFSHIIGGRDVVRSYHEHYRPKHWRHHGNG